MASAAASQQRDTGGIEFPNLYERVVNAILGCREHNWSFPQTDRKNMARAYAANPPYDSHQQCPNCGKMRLFNSQTMEFGPMFTKEPKKNG